jgi:hypothetical protein
LELHKILQAFLCKCSYLSLYKKSIPFLGMPKKLGIS